eukprot:gene9185-14245_t
MLLHVCSAVCLVLLTALTYRKAPSCGFVFDDHLAVVNNDDTNPTSPWSAILLHDFWGKPLRQADSNKSFRPVSTASFRLNRMWAGLAPSSFHCVNIALHTAVVLLVYRIAFESAEGVQPAEQPVDALRYFAAIISAALFAVHPVHVEAVTGVVGRAELLSCIFFCTAFILFSQREQPSALCCLGFVLASLAAAFAKETGITIVAVVIVDDQLAGSRKLWVSLFVVAAYFLIRLSAIGSLDLSGSRLLRKTENPLLFAESWSTRFRSSVVIQGHYLRLLTAPSALCCEYPAFCIPLSAGWGDIRFWGCTLVFFSLCWAITQACCSAKWRPVAASSLDETLFESALRVCPEGAKHHQQFAILQLNRNRPVTALRHLRRAQEIDSEWCEPALYIGKSVALLDGKPPTSTRLLEARMWWKTCVACPFVAGECFELFSAVQEGLIATGNTTAQHELGDVLHAMHEYRLGLAAYRQAGLQRFNAEDWEGAADSFRRAIGSWSVTEEDGLASNTISNTDAKKKKKMKQTKNTANSAPKGSSPDELQHPCNIFYWLAQAELNMLRHRSALEVYRRQFIECSQRQRAVNAAFEGIIQILQEAGRSPHILHRLHVSPAEALELQADVLLKASHNPLIASRSDTADALLQSAAELFAKLADRGDSDNGSDGKLCAFADKAVEAAGRRSLNSHDATFCRALLLQ